MFSPTARGIGLKQTAAATERGFVSMDASMRASAECVYAICELTGKVLIAHVESAQGVLAAEAIAGRNVRPLSYQDMPRTSCCQPQVASVRRLARTVESSWEDMEATVHAHATLSEA